MAPGTVTPGLAALLVLLVLTSGDQGAPVVLSKVLLRVASNQLRHANIDRVVAPAARGQTPPPRYY